jgi:hypothetical protein
MTTERDGEALITINGTTLTTAQSMAVRVAINSFRMELNDPEMAEGLGAIGRLYDERLIEVEKLIRAKE